MHEHGFNSHPGQSFSLSLCEPNAISRANAWAKIVFFFLKYPSIRDLLRKLLLNG